MGGSRLWAENERKIIHIMALHETSLVSDHMIIFNRMVVVLRNGSFKIVVVGLVLRGCLELHS